VATQGHGWTNWCQCNDQIIINNNGLLIQRLSENLKLAKITIILVFKSIKDECAFFPFAFMKDKLWNWLIALGHNCVHVCLSICHYTLEGWKGVLVLLFKKLNFHLMFVFYNWNINVFILNNHDWWKFGYFNMNFIGHAPIGIGIVALHPSFVSFNL
jgi:hypothetical protein